jgi:CRP-like cAMP-binding protein
MACLRDQELFRSSGDEIIKLASEMARVTDVKADEYVCFQGDIESPLILLLSGQLRTCTLSAEGHEIPIRIFGPGDSIGAASIVDESPITANVIATRKSTVVRLLRADARRLFLEPEVSRALNRLLARSVKGFASQHAEQGMPRAAARVSAVINSALSKVGDASTTIELPNQATLGAMAKVSRETVSRVLASLERCGVIAKEGRQISVQDRAALRTIALGSTNCPKGDL